MRTPRIARGIAAYQRTSSGSEIHCRTPAKAQGKGPSATYAKDRGALWRAAIGLETSSPCSKADSPVVVHTLISDRSRSLSSSNSAPAAPNHRRPTTPTHSTPAPSATRCGRLPIRTIMPPKKPKTITRSIQALAIPRLSNPKVKGDHATESPAWRAALTP